MDTLNKTAEEISTMHYTLIESIRHFISRKLFGYNEEKPLEVYIELDFGAVGLSSLEMPIIESMFEDKEGIIWMKYRDSDAYIEFDNFYTEDLIAIVKELDNIDN